MHSHSKFSASLKILAVALAATLYLVETATPQFPEQRLIPLVEPTEGTRKKEPKDYENQRLDLEEPSVKDQELSSEEFVVYGRAATDERAGIASSVEYRPIIHARTPEFRQREPNTLRMPDLESFFEFGGTLELLTPLTTNPTLAKYDIVMSELMWGLDTGINTSQFDPKFSIKIPDPDHPDDRTKDTTHRNGCRRG